MILMYRKCIPLVLIFCCTVFNTAAQVKDSSQIHWTAEAVYSFWRKNESYFGHYSSSSERKSRKEYFIGAIGEYTRDNKRIAPWLSPFFALNAGWFVSGHQEYRRYGGWYYNDNGYLEFFSESDMYYFESLTAIPQVGLNMRPFKRKGVRSKFTFSARVGYQLNWIQQYSSENISTFQELDYGSWAPNIRYTQITRYPSFKVRNFPKAYFQLGISHELKNNKLGFRLSYSWQRTAQRGPEFGITWRICQEK